MKKLDDLYCQLLQVGFVVLRQAADANDGDWVKAEIEFLHNVPSLIGEGNLERHRYFWFSEREHYIDWVAISGSDVAKSRLSIYYEPIWREMAPVMMEFLDLSDECQQVEAGSKSY